MALTPDEKICGRWWRDQMRNWLEADRATKPEMIAVFAPIAHFRHECPAFGKSISFEIKEVYILSPEMGGYNDVSVPAGRLAFVYREGRCARCGLHAGSPTGRVVDAYERPPVGRVTSG